MKIHHFPFLFLLFSFFLQPAPAGGRDWFVHPTGGADSNDGSRETPLATAQVAVNRAGERDRIVLLPRNGTYRQSISLAGAPAGLEIEGNGVTLTGADPIPARAWKQLAEDLYEVKLPRPDLDRHLLIVNGKAERMGRLCRDPVRFPPIEELEPGEFHWEDISETEGRLTYRGRPENLAWSVRRNGLSTSGEVRNVFVHRLSARHFLNDGFNIHGNARGLRFSEISGYENFDEGFSAHDTATCWIRNSTFHRNENAIADVNAADTYYENCVFHSSLAFEVLFYGGRHSLTRCRIHPGVGSIPLRIRSGELKGAPGPTPASLVIRDVTLDPVVARARRWEIGSGATVFVDTPSARQFATLTLDKHPASTLSNEPYRIFPIGRDASGAPLMAWMSGRAASHRSGNYRVIHFDKHAPAEVASTAPPRNDRFGLLSPLPSGTFPPEGDAFQPGHEASHAIWRWIGLTAPDAVFLPGTPQGLALGEALLAEPPAGVGMVTVFISERDDSGETRTAVLSKERKDIPSAADEMSERLGRSPSRIFDELAAGYGNSFSGNYLDALAIIAKKRRDPSLDLAPLAAPLLDSPMPKTPGNLSGTLLFAEWGTEEANERVVAVAGLAFAEDGSPKEAMPGHNEMSDSIFMAGPLLARAGAITGDERYHAQAIRHVRFMQDLCLREDGLYRHSPLHEAAWGRGNGFPVVGITMMLDHFPDDHRDREFLLQSLRSHLDALAGHQDGDGMWHQLIDHPDSYAEFTCTAMISYGIVRGIQENRIEREEWLPRLLHAWEGLKARIGTDGSTLVNVCTGTGKQRTLEDYHLRKAILGPDARGGGLALLLAGEMEKLQQQQ